MFFVSFILLLAGCLCEYLRRVVTFLSLPNHLHAEAVSAIRVGASFPAVCAEPSTRRSRLRDSGRRIVSRSLSSFEEPNHAQYFVTISFLQVESTSAIALVLILGWASFEDSTVDFVFDSLRRLQSRVLFRYLSTIPKSNHFSPSCDDSKVEFLFVITFL